MIRKISVKQQSTKKHFPKLDENNCPKEYCKSISWNLKKKKNSSSQNNQQFIKIKSNDENVKLQCKCNNSEAYNKMFILAELMDSINKYHSTVGP